MNMGYKEYDDTCFTESFVEDAQVVAGATGLALQVTLAAVAATVRAAHRFKVRRTVAAATAQSPSLLVQNANRRRWTVDRRARI